MIVKLRVRFQEPDKTDDDSSESFIVDKTDDGSSENFSVDKTDDDSGESFIVVQPSTPTVWFEDEDLT